MHRMNSPGGVTRMPAIVSTWFLVCTVLPAGAGAATITASSCSRANVQTAINAASDGDTVLVPAGSCTWNEQVSLSNAKGVSLIGAGQGSTVITAGTTGPILGLNALSGVNSRFYRISNFTFTTSLSGAIPIWFYGYRQTATLSNFRIDHNTFSNFFDGIAILLGETTSANDFYGVIDHNTFTGSVNFLGVKLLGPGEPYRASPKGTADNLFIEDNLWDFASATGSTLGSGCIDSWLSGSVVFRHNTTRNCLVTSHGVVHGGGTISFEVYENLLTRTSGGGDWLDGTRLFHHQGSGEIILFNNRFTVPGSKSGDVIGMTHYRSADPSEAGYSGSRCDGYAAGDGNRAPRSTYYGYPCHEQPGRMAGDVLSPMYFWNNRWTDNGVKIDVSIENPWPSGPPFPTDHIKADRDFYNAVSASAQTSRTSPFDGTTGMGFGTLANRPTACTTNPLEPGGGVGYFATDNNTLYRCSAADTWVEHYKPYTYPHPLTVYQGTTGVRRSTSREITGPAARFSSTSAFAAGFVMSREADVKLNAYDISGKHIGTLLNCRLPAGSYRVPLKNKGWSARACLLKLAAEGHAEVQKMVNAK